MLYLLLTYLFVFAEPGQGYATPQLSHSDSGLTLYVFTGSDWCANCRRFDRKVLHDSAFITAMKGKHIRIEILDFPQRKKLSAETVAYNQAMSEKLGFKNIFPTVVLYSSSGTGKQKTLYYRNEAGAEFSAMVLNELGHLNE